VNFAKSGAHSSMFHIQVDLVAHVAKFTNLELYSRGYASGREHPKLTP